MRTRRLAGTMAALLLGSYARVLMGGPPEADLRPLSRTEYLAPGERPLRLSRIIEQFPAQRKFYREHSLLSVGDDSLFYLRMEVDLLQPSRHFILKTGKRSEECESYSDAREPDLTSDEVHARMWIVRVGDEKLKASIDDINVETVKLRIAGMLSTWRPKLLSDLRSLYQAIQRCSLQITKGDLLRFLFSDDKAERGNCQYQFAFAPPDPVRDQRFVPLEQDLASLLKRPAELLNAPKK
jgi:hypothetical protein